MTAGFASASLGIGGGIIFVPALLFLLHYDIRTVVGTSLASIAPTALVGAITHYIVGTSDFKGMVILFLALGSVFNVTQYCAICHKSV